jgi:hypothetical protein
MAWGTIMFSKPKKLFEFDINKGSIVLGTEKLFEITGEFEITVFEISEGFFLPFI